MNERRKIEERIRKKDLEIQDLQGRLRDAQVYVQALQDVLKLLPRETETLGDTPVLREGSSVADARELILKAMRPLHISEILEGLGKDVNRDNRASLGGSLAAYVRRGEIFSRPSPGRFWLVELGDPPKRSAEDRAPAPPPEKFGEIDDIDDEIPF